MTNSFSAYLNIVRFLAALAVFFDHISSYPFTKDVVWPRLGSYGAVAVTIFFVLSGYVIAYVTSTKEKTAAEYFSSRTARLYSVVLITLLLTFVFDTIGMKINPDFYGIRKVLWKPESWTGYVSSMLFLNEFQVFEFGGVVPGTNGPYWSLSFEATYYVVAGLVIFFRKRIWLPATVFILCLAGKTIAVLLPVWAIGCFLYSARLSANFHRSVYIVLFFGSALMVLATPKIAGSLPGDNFGFWFPWGRGPFNRNVLQDYIVALAFVVNLAAARELLTDSIKIGPIVGRFINWAGSLTFPLYCLHYPAICLLAAVSPWGQKDVEHFAFISMSVAALVILVTPVCDALKQAIRAVLTGGCSPKCRVRGRGVSNSKAA